LDKGEMVILSVALSIFNRTRQRGVTMGSASKRLAQITRLEERDELLVAFDDSRRAW
jgi:hypothetical protein